MKIILLSLILISRLAWVSNSWTAKNKFTFSGIDQSDGYLDSVSVAGDLNGDGFNDIVIGVPGQDENRGAVYVIYGGETISLSDIDFSTSPALDPLTTGFMITGNAEWAQFGFSVSCAGDINRDGYDDILIGAANKDYSKGGAYVIYGGKNQDFSNRDLSSQPLDPATTGFLIGGNFGNFGYSVSNSGDFDNDGYHDILIGAPSSGAAYVIYGGEKSSASNIDISSTPLNPATTGFTLTGATWTDSLGPRFGHSVSSAGDVDKDGYDDLVIGAWRNDDSAGAAYVIYGGKKSTMSNIYLSETALKPATTGFMIQGRTWDKLGYSVSSAGDFNNDGYDDVIIGAMGAGGTQGATYIVYGRERSSLSNIELSKVTLDPAETGVEIVGDYIGDKFGHSVSSAGDINKDGFDDVLVGANERDNFRGAAYVIYGGGLANMQLSEVTLDPAKNGFVIAVTYTYAEFGNSVSSGDINNDGVPDFLIGAWNDVPSSGFAYAFVSDKCTDHCGKCNYFEAVCNTCSLGYRLDKDLCEACIANCDTCTDSSTCQVCSEGFSLLGTTCTASCPDEMYSENRVCQDCAATCSKCTSESVCQECKSPYLKHDSQCVASCPAKTYSTNTHCFDCPVGCSKCTSGSVCQECDEDYTLSYSKVCLNLEAEEKKSEKAFAAIFEGTFLASAALSSGSSLPFNFALVGKVLRNLRYIDTTVSTELTETFYSWKANGFLRAPKSWSEKSDSKILPTVFSRYGLDPVFLINFWKPFVLSLIGLAVYAIFRLAEIFLKKKNKEPFYKISRHVHIAASNFALTIFYCNLDDVFLYLIIEFRSTKSDNGFRRFSSALAIMLFILGGFLMCLHLIFVREYQKLKNTEALLNILKDKYENTKLIFRDFQDTTFFKQSFILMIVGRSLISSLIFGTLFDYPVLQTTLLLILNIAMVVVQLARNSFKETLNRWGQLFAEVVLVIVVIMVFVLSMLDYANSHPVNGIERLSKCIIVFNAILLLGCSVIMIFSLGKSFYESYKKARELSKITALPDNSSASPPVDNMISFGN